MKPLLSIAAGCVAAAAALAPATGAYGLNLDTRVILARADNGVRDHLRHGRDDGAIHKRQRADDPASDVPQGRGRDDGAMHKRHGADNPIGDLRQARGRDDATINRDGADDPPGDRHGRRDEGRHP